MKNDVPATFRGGDDINFEKNGIIDTQNSFVCCVLGFSDKGHAIKGTVVSLIFLNLTIIMK